MVECDNCKLRELGGKEVYATENPAWKKWKRNQGSSVLGRAGSSKSSSPEPARYIACPLCKAKGKKKCSACNGSKKASCPRCGEKGYIIAPGTCPECNGDGLVACPDCIVLPEDIEDNPAIQALLSLKEKKLLSPKEYFARLRLLAQKERAAMEEEEERKVALEAQQAEEAKRAEEEKRRAAIRQEKRVAVETLIDAVETEALSLQMYTEKVRLLALYPDDLWQLESDAAKEKPRFKRYLTLKQKFRNGEMDLDAYRKAIKEF